MFLKNNNLFGLMFQEIRAHYIRLPQVKQQAQGMVWGLEQDESSHLKPQAQSELIVAGGFKAFTFRYLFFFLLLLIFLV